MLNNIINNTRLSDRQKDLIAFSVMFIIITASFLVYYNHKVKVINAEYTGQLVGIQDEMRERNDRVAYELKKLEESVNERSKKIESELKTSNIQLSKSMAERLANLQNENKKEIVSISGKLSQLESEKNDDIDQLEDRMKTISVKNEDFSLAVKKGINSVVSVETFSGKASGTVIKSTDAASYIVTSLHVLDPRASVGSVIVIETKDGLRETAGIVGVNTQYDLAVLKISMKLPALSFGDSKNLAVGERVFALGNPGGIGISVSEGIVSAVKRYVGTIPYIQTDSPINEGNSGGPLINGKGDLIGINTLKITGYEGIGLATPSYIVESAANSIISNSIKN